MSFFENTRKPKGLGGKVMVTMMNIGHRALASWGMRFLPMAPDAKVLDCGCGGGANIQKLLKKCPQGIVKGIDYSAVSVEKAIFAESWFDLVTAFETVYFWPHLPQCFQEVLRVLKPGDQ